MREETSFQEQATPETIIDLARHVSEVSSRRTAAIAGITRRTKILALNAKIEAARAGSAGAGFGIVAREVQNISEEIDAASLQMQEEIVGSAKRLHRLGVDLVGSMRGQRLADLALNMIDIIDRNLYERSCDVRWWATDSAVVNAVEQRSPSSVDHASFRLGVILKSYTVYLDLWICDVDGRVVASGRPDHFNVVGRSVYDMAWFRKALATQNGSEFVATDIECNAHLNNSPVATYATAIREGGREDGKPIGVLGIFFDWEPQARSVLRSIRLTADERRENRTKCLIIDSDYRILAASDDQNVLSGRYALQKNGQDMGYFRANDGAIAAFALTPGYETYRGMGWYGLIIQRSAEAEAAWNAKKQR